jgi:hypothetical protein
MARSTMGTPQKKNKSRTVPRKGSTRRSTQRRCMTRKSTVSRRLLLVDRSSRHIGLLRVRRLAHSNLQVGERRTIDAVIISTHQLVGIGCQTALTQPLHDAGQLCLFSRGLVCVDRTRAGKNAQIRTEVPNMAVDLAGILMLSVTTVDIRDIP